MPNLSGVFSWMDLVIFLALCVGVYVGYSQGSLRQLVGLGAMYLGVILASQNYLLLSDFLDRLFRLGIGRFGNVLCFLFIFIGVTLAINLLAADAYQMTRLKIAPTVDLLGGSFLGFVTVVIILAFLLPVLRFVSAEPFPYVEAARAGVVHGLDTSRLAPLILLYRPLIFSTITPWLPYGLPAILG